VIGGYELLARRRQISLPEGWKISNSWRDGDLSFCRPVQYGSLYVDRVHEQEYMSRYEGIFGSKEYGGPFPLHIACSLSERSYCGAHARPFASLTGLAPLSQRLPK